jgi:PAS domain-containing protein
MDRASVEIILLKQLAGCLATPMFVMGPEGHVSFFNESAEHIIGRRFDEMGGMNRDEWAAAIQATDDHGTPLSAAERPLLSALDHRAPIHRRLWLHGYDGQRHHVDGTAIPLVAENGRFLGALGVFWKLEGDKTLRPRATSGHEVEIILLRRLATYLAVPVLILDNDGGLVFFNRAAEPILGAPFEEVDLLPGDLYASFASTGDDGVLIKMEEHPLSIARLRHEPAHRPFWIRGLDGVQRRIECTALPLIGQSERILGAFGLFWEMDPK